MKEAEKKEIYIVWLNEWRAYRVCFPEKPQQSLARYTTDLKRLLEATEKKFPDRVIRIFQDESGKPFTEEQHAVNTATAWIMCAVGFAAGVLIAFLLGLL